MSHYTILPLAERMKRYHLVLLALASASYLLIACSMYRESTKTSPGSIQKPRFEPRQIDRLRPLVIGNPEISEFANSMAIVEVLGGSSGRVNYKTAIDSVECYAHMNGHYMYILETEDFFRECGHYKDFFYRRHCVIHVLMEATSHEWYSFLDSDMEIININGSFQDYVGPHFDVYLYDRFFNWEITAGAYIVRGNQFGRDFVRGFGEYEFGHPRIRFHGTDNAGIHFFLASLVLGADSNLSECWHLWEKSTGWDGVFVYEWCIRKKLGARSDFGRIKIYSKGRGWARDGPLTKHQFAPEVDFIIHARKEVRKFSANNTGGWHDARTVPLVMEDCRAGTQQWINNDTHLIKPEEVQKRLSKWVGGIFRFLKGVHSRQNLTAEFKQDMVNHRDVIGWFSTFPFDPQWHRRL